MACRVLGISRQAYYQWLRDPVSQRDWDDAHLINAALEFMPMTRPTGTGRVWRICSMQKIFSLHVRKKGLSRAAGPPVHDDLFAAASPPMRRMCCG